MTIIEGVSEAFSRVFNKYIVDGSGPEPEVTELLIVVSIVLALLWLVQRFVSWGFSHTHTLASLKAGVADMLALQEPM